MDVRGSADPAGRGGCDLEGRGSEVELVAATGQVVFQLAEGLVLLVADAGDGHAERFTDLGDGPAAGPELDDPVLSGREHGLPGGFEDLAEFLPVSVALVD